MKTAILILQTKDQTGIIAKISNFIFQNNANIISLDQYSTNPKNGRFFMRMEFYFDEKEHSLINLQKSFTSLANSFQASWKIIDKSQNLKMGILLSQPDHCLAELLYRWQSEDLKLEIPFIISNHNIHQKIANQYKIPFYYISEKNQEKAEEKILQKIKSSDFLVLARYMQILSQNFLKTYSKHIINIHHSFLPSFKGAEPYKQAFNRGVKIIGATAHFVTENLDEGPIIVQNVESVTHKDQIQDLKKKGKHLEKLTLAKAVELYTNYRIFIFENKTIIF